MDFTSIIPNEILDHIFSLLDGDEIFPCLGVSKRWRQIVNTDRIWRPICLKVRILDPFPDSADILPLCSWAKAYFHCRCVPMHNWRNGVFQVFSIEQESEYFRIAWDGNYVAIFYYTLGVIYLYSIYGKVKLIQKIKVPLPKLESYNASISMNDPYIARYNVAVIFKRNSKYSLYEIISVTDTFVFGNYLNNYNVKLSSEIAWECLWMKADTVEDTFMVNLKNGETRLIPGRPHLAFNNGIKLVVAWTDSSVKVLNTIGDIKLTLVRNELTGVDFDSKFLVLKGAYDIEIVNIQTGDSIIIITNPRNGEVEFILSHDLFYLLAGKKNNSLTAVSPINGKILWSEQNFSGRPSVLRLIGSKYIFFVPSYFKNNYYIFDRKGKFIRENDLPDDFIEYSNPVQTLPFLLFIHEYTFNIASFM